MLATFKEHHYEYLRLIILLNLSPLSTWSIAHCNQHPLRTDLLMAMITLSLSMMIIHNLYDDPEALLERPATAMAWLLNTGYNSYLLYALIRHPTLKKHHLKIMIGVIVLFNIGVLLSVLSRCYQDRHYMHHRCKHYRPLARVEALKEKYGYRSRYLWTPGSNNL